MHQQSKSTPLPNLQSQALPGGSGASANHAQLRQQLALARAINRLATAIGQQDEPERLLDEAVEIVGAALGVDRASIYDVSLSERTAHGLSEFLNTTEVEIASVKAEYAMDDFASAARTMADTRQYLESHAQAVHPCMLADASASLLHGRWGVQSLLWYPFGFREGAYYFMALNQVRYARAWSSEDLEFLDSCTRLISLALAKRAHLLHEREQANQLRIAAAAFESQEALMVTDEQGVILKVNQAFSRITGYTAQDMLGKTPRVLQSGRHSREFYVQMWDELKRTGKWSGEIWDRHKNGRIHPKWLAITAVHRPDGTVSNYIGSHFDLSEQKAAEAAMLGLNKELRESRQRLRQLAAQNEAQLENERKHVAREVHDELGQILTGLRMGILAMDMRHGAQHAELRRSLHDLKLLTDQAVEAVRNVAMHLRPAALELGFVPALEWLCKEFSWRTGLPCGLVIEDESIKIDESRMTVIFRIVQESLTNIARYARPSRVRINVGRREDELGVEIQDNGIGFDLREAGRRDTFGLLGMRERAIALGGHVDIVSAPGKGTTVGLTIPLGHPMNEESHDPTGDSR